MGFCDRARSGWQPSTSFKSVNMQNGGSIRSHDCYLKKCVENSLTQYIFFMWWNLGFLVTASVIFISLVRLKKRSTEKETPWERLPKGDRFESLCKLRYRSWRSFIPLRNVLRQRK